MNTKFLLRDVLSSLNKLDQWDLEIASSSTTQMN